MKTLPRYPHSFLFWWVYTAPKYLFTVVKRMIVIINSRISFTLNFRLLFTPLFGDYTVIGRFIGFFVRIFEVVFGLLIIGTLIIISIILPLVWWLLPVYLFIELKLWLLLVITGTYFIWNILSKDTPTKKVAECNEDDWEKCFRPKSREFLDELKEDRYKGIKIINEDKLIKQLLMKSELAIPEFLHKLETIPSLDINQLHTKSLELANNNKSRYVEPEHVYVAFISLISNVDALLSTYSTTLTLLTKTMYWLVTEREILASLFIWQPNYKTVFTGGFGKGMTTRVTPFLDSISIDYTREAIRGGYKRYTVREEPIQKVADLLSGSNENLLIIGDPGSGKTSLIKGIAYKIMEGTKSKSLNNKRIVSMELSGIVAGTKSIGEMSDQIRGAIQDAKRSGGIILFIDEIHTLIAGGSANPEISALYSILEPELSTNTIQFIGATTSQNYRKYIEPNGAFSRLFNIFEITEATKEETIEILKYDVRNYERKYKISITYPALEKAIDLSKKLIHERVLPDKAVQIIGRAVTRITNSTKLLNSYEVAMEIADMTHIPSALVTEDEAKRLLNIETEMRNMVIGQDEALKQVGSAIKRARAGVRNETKPIASFLFVGTTGVGKTQTAKALAKIYFGDVKNMIRLDMSEYQQIDSISRLLGAPDGTTKGILTESIRTHPFCLILLDELEKSHPNILLTFLQVLDDGRLTDSSGTTVDFTNTIIIATSNVGTRAIQEVFLRSGEPSEMIDTAMREVRSHYAPEFLNRFTGIVVFNPLTQENVKQITTLLLKDVAANVNEKGIKVNFKDEIYPELMKRGYNPEWGARPMQRVIEDTIESFLAEKILSKELKQGDSIDIGLEAFTTTS